MDNDNKEQKNKNYLPYEKYLKEIIANQKKLHNCSIAIIVLLLAITFLKYFVIGF